MLTFILLVLLTLLFFLLLWVTRNQRPPATSTGGYGTRVDIPGFKPGPRPTTTFIEPPRKPVVIEVMRDERGYPIGLDVDHLHLQLPAGQQLGWSGGRSLDGSGAKVEIRFSPNATPFAGASFSTSRSGRALSGTASRGAGEARKYTILATTPDGYLLTKIAEVTPVGGQEGYGDQSGQTAPKGGFGTRVVNPNFKPGPRPGGRKLPPSQEVRISVRRGDGDELRIIVEPEEVILDTAEQIAWTTGDLASDTGGKIEIRFAPNATPFAGHTFITARGGTALSGFPSSGGFYPYKVLLTTPEGDFQLRKLDASVRVKGH
jgi:hypothetical protein